MKYCEEYAALLDLFVDGELTPEDMRRMEGHLAECPGCRAYVDDALAIRAGFPCVEDTVVPEGFAQGVMERIRESSSREGKTMELKRRSARRWAGTVAALAACCALVILVRTGPAGGEESASPAGEEYGTVCYDTGAAEESVPEEPPHAEMSGAAPEAPAEVPAEKMESRAARMGDSEADEGEAPLPALTTGGAPGTAMDGLQPYASAPGAEVALYLDQEEAGDLLDGSSVVWENGLEWCYQLNAEEFRALLEALGRQEELPEEEGPFLVVVSGPLE